MKSRFLPTWSRTLTVAAVPLLLGLLAACSASQRPQSAFDAKLELLQSQGFAGSAEAHREDSPGEAAAWWAGLHETPAGKTTAELDLEAMEQIRGQIESRRGAVVLPNFRFEGWGPGNFGGRLRSIVIKTDAPNQILVGAVAGGIFKSTDGGNSWSGANDFLPNLAISSMVIDPDNANRVFAGTGEGFFNIDSMQGRGIYVSTDFGTSWTLLGGTDNANFNFVNRLVAVPGTNKLLAATRTGIWGTDNFTAPTPVWTERSGTVASGNGFSDLKIDPSTTTPNVRIYGYHYAAAVANRRVWRSSNDGASFTVLGATEGIPTTDIGRMEIGVGTDGVVYLSVGNGADATRGLYRSAAGGAAFTLQASTPAFIERQAWYDLIVGVKPGDSNTVLVGAVDVYRSTNGGTTITKQTFWNPGVGQYPDRYVHADLHAVAFDPTNPNTVYIGCDGGLFKSTDSGTTWTDLNNNLPVAQYYGIAAHPNGRDIIGGTQDNGSHIFFGEQAHWLEFRGGDGGYSAWDHQQPQFLYGANPAGDLFGSADGGQTTVDITLPSTAGAPFITPFHLDVNNGAHLLAGTNRVYYSANIRALGTATFTDLTGALTGAVSALRISPLNGNVAYAGTSAGRLYRTTTLGTGAWTQIQDAAWSGSDVTSIAVDPHDLSGNTLYVTLADYAANRVYKSTNGGSSWTSIHANLPNIPMFSLEVDPLDADRLFLGSELGLFTTDGNSTSSWNWQIFDYGVPFTRVTQLEWAGPNQEILWLGTHGRSMFKGFRHAETVRLGALTGVSGCDADGFLDAFETATLPVTIRNQGPSTLTNVQASLSGVAPGLISFSGTLAYGSILPGAEATANFAIRMGAVPTCRTQAELDVVVSYDGGGSTHRQSLYTGADPLAGPLVEDFEDDLTPFTHEAAIGADDWARVNTAAHTGSSSFFAADINGFADKSLVSLWLLVGGGSTTLSFWLRYDMEGDASQRWDGTVLELRTEGGEWTDIGTLSSVPYDGPLFENNTIPGRMAWSGTQLTWRNAVVNLGATYNGQRVQFRFRAVCDSGTANVGVWIDDVNMTNVEWPGCDQHCSFRDGFETGNSSLWSVTVP